MAEVHAPEPRSRGIYLLPNLLTTAALFAGFYAVIATLKGRLPDAAIAIFIAMLADNLDGRVARLTRTQTAFGAEYDSLSDLLAFGMAPAVLAFKWGLATLGQFGWLVAFLYVAATALRLARFNTQLGVLDKRYFQGLPSPAAAAVVASFVWVVEKNQWLASGWLIIPLAVLMVMVALLMVSRLRFHSFKEANWQGRVPFVSLFILVLVFAFVALDPPEVLLALSVLFAFSGPVLTLWNLRKRRRARHKSHKTGN